ncbi:MAG TPA: hypothetical protein VGI88_06070 [Verrucomicrobiae bacterium]
MDTSQLIALLENALKDPKNRHQLIQQFQREIWDINANRNDPITEILRDLAYDLDFYEPNPKVRAEDPSFFDDTKLEEKIRESLKKLSS